MVLSGAGLVVPLIVGAILGWLAGMIVKDRDGRRTRPAGTTVAANVAAGMVGALLAAVLLPRIGWRMTAEAGLAGRIVFSAAGAAILLVAVRLLRRPRP